MKLTDALRDLVQTIAGIDFECIEVVGDGDRVFFKAFTPDKTLVMRAETKEPIAGIDVCKFGISNLDVLRGLMNLKTYGSEDTAISYNPENERLSFAAEGAKTEFILQKGQYVPVQPRFTERDYDISIDPNTAKIAELKSFSSVFKSFSSVVTPYTEDNELKFFVGANNKNTHSGVMGFAKTEQTLKRGYGFSVDRLMQSTARLGSAKTKQMNIAGTGMLNITIDTGIIEYKFFIQGE